MDIECNDQYFMFTVKQQFEGNIKERVGRVLASWSSKKKGPWLFHAKMDSIFSSVLRCLHGIYCARMPHTHYSVVTVSSQIL